MTIITKIDTEGRLRIPEEWAAEFAPEQTVELVRCDDGVLVKPLHQSPLAVALRRKVMMKQPTHLDLSDIDMDRIGW